jgi:hypothetical protein
MTTSIERKLPEELLANVISLTAKEFMPNLCLASKTLNRLTTPQLYSNITLGDEDNDGETIAVARFAYTIFSSPDYAPLVNSIIINEWYESQETEGEDVTFNESEWPTSAKQETEMVLRRKCEECVVGKEEAEKLYQKIKSGRNEDAILALLLASLTNIRKLDFSFGEGDEHPEFVAMLEMLTSQRKSAGDPRLPAINGHETKKASSIPLTAFSTPVDIMVKGTSDKYPSHTDVLAVFFNLPNLRAIYAWRFGDSELNTHEEGNASSRLKPRSCPVEYIELRFSKLHTDDLRSLMSATIPGKLKTFNYETGGAWIWVALQHPEIMKTLEPHHDTLESLGLSHESDFYPYEMEDPDDKPYPVSFTSFKALKHLKVAPVFIWGHDFLQNIWKMMSPEKTEMLWKALPEAIEQLWVTEAENYSDDAAIKLIPDCLLPALELVVEKKPHTFPKLSELRIQLPLMSWDNDWFDTLATLCTTADAKGIQTTVILHQLPTYFDDDGDNDNVERAWGWNEDVQWQEAFANQESPKRWIVAAEEADLGKMLKDLKAKFADQKEAYLKARKAQN